MEDEGTEADLCWKVQSRQITAHFVDRYVAQCDDQVRCFNRDLFGVIQSNNGVMYSQSLRGVVEHIIWYKEV